MKLWRIELYCAQWTVLLSNNKIFTKTFLVDKNSTKQFWKMRVVKMTWCRIVIQCVPLLRLYVNTSQPRYHPCSIQYGIQPYFRVYKINIIFRKFILCVYVWEKESERELTWPIQILCEGAVKPHNNRFTPDHIPGQCNLLLWKKHHFSFTHTTYTQKIIIGHHLFSWIRHSTITLTSRKVTSMCRSMSTSSIAPYSLYFGVGGGGGDTISGLRIMIFHLWHNKSCWCDYSLFTAALKYIFLL